MAPEHKPAYIVVILMTVVIFLLTLVINYMAGVGKSVLFHNTTGSVSEYYYLEITPAGWTFGVLWTCIYAWQITWLLYATSTLFRRTSYGYLYVNPGHIPIALYPCFIVNNVTNFSWLIVWDRFLPEYGLILLTASTVSLYVALYLSFRRLYKTGTALIQEKQRKEVWLTRILLQNGMAFYATWVTIATLINLCVVMTYKGGVSQSVSSTVGLCLLAFIIGAWFFAEIAFYDNYVRYIVSPYVVVILALSGSIAKNWDYSNNNSAITAFILTGACLAAVCKGAATVWRHKRVPIFQELPFYKNGRTYGSCEYMPISVS